jgi:hypothetical protein
MEGSRLKILFQRQRVPWRHSRNDPPKPPFEPIMREVMIRKRHVDGSIDVKLGEISLSNGNGPTYLMDLLNLKMDMTVRYYKNILPKYMEEDLHFSKFMIKHPGNLSPEPQEWIDNVPTWKPLFYSEARLGAVWCILCLKRMKIFPKELIKMIAGYVDNSFHDMCWFRLIVPPQAKEPLTKRIKK